MALANFQHKVSKGSRFNQIYIPKEMQEIFEVGDLVEVKLLGKKEKLHYSDNLKNFHKISDFKENIIKQVFFLLEKFKEIKQVFIVGSFLIEKTEYNDIDIILVSDKKEIEKKVYTYLSEKIQMNFHVIVIPEKKIEGLIKICPLTRSMFYYFISNKEFSLNEQVEIEKKHISFLLMMPEDLLKIKLSNGKIYFDSLRRLITIRRFLEKQKLDSILINQKIKKILGKNYSFLKDNKNIDQKTLIFVNEEIKKELNKINKILKGIKNK